MTNIEYLLVVYHFLNFSFRRLHLASLIARYNAFVFNFDNQRLDNFKT